MLLLGVTRIGVLLVASSAVLWGAFGLWLVHLGHFGYGSGWVDASISLDVVALALKSLGAGVQSRLGGSPRGSATATRRQR